MHFIICISTAISHSVYSLDPIAIKMNIGLRMSKQQLESGVRIVAGST